MRRTIEDIGIRVARSTPPSTSPDETDAAVTDTYSEYDDSPVRDFVPVLVERSVKQDLHGR